MPRPRAVPLLLALAATVGGCAREELLHGLDEGQANVALVALDEGGVAAEKRRDEGAEGSWRLEVRAVDGPRARRVLADRELPRQPAPGFGEVFGKGSVVPSPSEERALYLHALSGELARSVEAVDGVVAARVHLAIAAPDPVRGDAAPPARAAVLVKARPGARARLDPLVPGIQALVAGAVPGLDAAAVAVVVTDAASPAWVGPAAPAHRALLQGLAAAAGALGLAAAAAAFRPPLSLAPLASLARRAARWRRT